MWSPGYFGDAYTFLTKGFQRLNGIVGKMSPLFYPEQFQDIRLVYPQVIVRPRFFKGFGNPFPESLPVYQHCGSCFRTSPRALRSTGRMGLAQ